jgi:hypothetical protein
MPQKPAQEHDQPCLGTVLTAPKARAIPAWGEAPCTRPDNVQGLKARSIHNSIPQIPFIEFHPIFREKCAKFILKRLFPMMHLLTIDVTNQGIQIRRPTSYSTANRTWGFTPCWYRAAPLALSLSPMTVLVCCLFLSSIASAQSPPLHIKIINAQTNKPVPNERLNVALKVDQIGSVAMATDKNGIISVDYGNATIIRILANMYADCRPRGELYTNYAIDTILKTGITTGNLCSSAQPKAHPGQLILFEVPKTYIPVFPAPPNSTLPHSDENPHQPQN